MLDRDDRGEQFMVDESKVSLIHILYELLKEIADVNSDTDIYSTILDAAAKAIPNAQYGSVLVIEDGWMRYAASFGFKDEYLHDIRFKVEDTLLYRYTDGRLDKAVIINNFTEENKKKRSGENTHLLEKAGSFKVNSSISIPIRSNEKALGSLHLDSALPNAFREEDIKILELFALELSGIMRLLENIEAKNYLLRYDDMTGILNRRYAGEQIRELIAQKIPFILVSMDIDNLKTVNDTMGHEAGDEYIKHFVDGINRVIDEDSIFGRYGGDEFVLVFPRGNAEDVLHRMKETEQWFIQEGKFRKIADFDLTFSYGIVDVPEQAQGYDRVMQVADERMYLFKRLHKQKAQ